MKNSNIAIGVEFSGRESSIVQMFIVALPDLILNVVTMHKFDRLYGGLAHLRYDSRDALIQAPGAERALPTASIRLASRSVPHLEPLDAQLS